MRLALIGFGNVGRAFARLLENKRATYPFRIVAIHTDRRGTAYDDQGLTADPLFGPAAQSVDEFFARSQAEVAIEVTKPVLQDTDILASVEGTSNLLLIHTDLMGTIGTVSVNPGVEQTAYGVFSDVVDIARTI